MPGYHRLQIPEKHIRRNHPKESSAIGHNPNIKYQRVSCPCNKLDMYHEMCSYKWGSLTCDMSEPLLKTLNLLKIEDIMKTKALKLYYRYKQNELPKYFESMFTESNDNHSHDTRHKSLLYQLPTKTSTGRLCIRHYIPELLSKTPECITEKLDTHSFSGFSNYMKNYYIRNCNENCLIENCYICQNWERPSITYLTNRNFHKFIIHH